MLFQSELTSRTLGTPSGTCSLSELSSLYTVESITPAALIHLIVSTWPSRIPSPSVSLLIGLECQVFTSTPSEIPSPSVSGFLGSVAIWITLPGTASQVRPKSSL